MVVIAKAVGPMRALDQVLNLLLTAVFSLSMLLAAHLFMQHRTARELPTVIWYRSGPT
jgi:hypothetical protein